MDDSLYPVLFESYYMHIESGYHGIDLPEENIRDCLTASLELYDADRAFILELDEELDACQYLYSKMREGYGGPDGDAVDQMLFSSLFSGIIKKGEPFKFETEALKAAYPAEYDWLAARGIENVSAVPFTTRTELVAFFGVYNVRRFFDRTSFLSLSTKALSNEIRALRMRQLVSAAKHNSPELSDDDVVVKLFGGFEITTNIGSIDFTDLSSVQCGRFLLYLLKNRNRTIPIREIAEILWPDQLIDNPYNMVKGVAFRVRKILENICPHKLVVAKSGTYALNDALTIILDVESFDKTCDRVRSSKLSSIERLQIYENALRIYKGDMLPNYESEIWLLGWVGYYQIKYLEILKEYLALLRETEQYAKIFEVVSNVLSVGYEDGEIYEVLIDALVKQNKFELARSYYTRVEKLLSPERRRHFIEFWNAYKNENK